MGSLRVTVEIGIDYDKDERSAEDAREMVQDRLDRIDVFTYANVLDYQEE